MFRNAEELAEFTDWRVAEPGNRVWVFRPLAPGDTLRVDYAYEAAPIFRSYARRSLREIGREIRTPLRTPRGLCPRRWPKAPPWRVGAV